ncbi:Coiled-coil domain-containing protein 96 [Pteropus alecto]|uniref:Coiled-coil domain-containing protein 96 n=1 Tax=Pteropus alecto TaxID=9402 RepID=L5K490_PTEAL|nr:Coiled-coil domain-containing protein 96 [Pteropus alecto]
MDGHSERGPAAAGAAGEEGPEQREWPADTEPEEPAKPESDGGLVESEKEREEAAEEEGRGKKAPSRGSPPPATASGEKAEREGPEAKEEGAGEEEEEKESTKKSVEGSGAKSELEQKGLDKEPEDESSEWTEEVQKRQEQQLRSELLEQYRSLVLERSQYQRYNIYLQHKIFEALRKKKGLDAAEVLDRGLEPESPEKEQAYLHYLAALEELKKQQADDLDWYHQELAQLKQLCTEQLSKVEKEWRAFQALKKQVVMQAMGSCQMRGGRQAALREVEQIQALEEKKEEEMSTVRLENVQLKQGLMHFETRMRAQEDVTEGLLLIDFEQLKIENQTFNEKVEERNEELLKLRSKVNNNVQIITHVKEKLHFVDIENACKRSQLLETEAQVALRRDILTKTKQARDSLRMDNIKLNQRCGLLGKELLLRDMEKKVDKTAVLKRRLESLKRHHAGLSLSCRGVKQKIREAKAFLPS